MATYQARPHPTDSNGRHDDRYLTESETNAAIDAAVSGVVVPVDSVNGQTGPVVLDAGDVGALDQPTADSLYPAKAPTETAIATLTFAVYDPADPAYGATRSVTDPGTSVKTANTAAINAAAADALANEGVLVIKGNYWIDGEVVVDCTVDATTGSLTTAMTSGTALLVGTRAAGVKVERKHMILPKVINGAHIGAGWSGGANTDIGIEIANVNACHIEIPHVRRFSRNLLIAAYAQGNAYNTYILGHLDNGKVQLDIAPQPSTSTGWCNENLYVGGRFSHNSEEGEAIVGVRQIRLNENGIYGPDNNIFIKPSLEGVAAEYHVEIIEGRDNRIIQARWETATGNPRVLYQGARATHNHIDGGYNAEDIEYTQSGTVGGNLHTDWSGTRYVGTNPDAATAYTSNRFAVHGAVPSRMVSTSSDANPTLIALPLGSTSATPDSAYGFQTGMTRTRFKAAADTQPRIEVFNNLGIVRFGSGTAAGDTDLRRHAANVAGTGADDGFRTGLFTIATLPAASAYLEATQVYLTDVDRPCWSNGSIWKYADGTNV